MDIVGGATTVGIFKATSSSAVELDLGLPEQVKKPQSSVRQTALAARSIADHVMEFHRAFDLPVSPRPTTEISDTLRELRIDLLSEEVGEYVVAASQSDIVAIADALADILYVVYGSALTYGIDLDRVVNEVHRSNMSKLAADGTPLRRADGKVLKGPQYSPPSIAPVLLDQPPLFW